MDNVLAIALSDFNERIFFLNTKPNFDFDTCFKIVQSINKNISVNHAQDYIHSGSNLLQMDSVVGSKLKVKAALIGEISSIVIFNSQTDFYTVNIINQRMIESLYSLTKTRRIKPEMLSKKHIETCNILEDTLNLMDPKTRMQLKEGQTMINKNVANHSIYLYKLVRGNGYLRGLAYQLSTKEFGEAKTKKENKLKATTSIKIKREIGNLMILKRNNLIHLHGGNTINAEFTEDTIYKKIDVVNPNDTTKEKYSSLKPTVLKKNESFFGNNFDSVLQSINFDTKEDIFSTMPNVHKRSNTMFSNGHLEHSSNLPMPNLIDFSSLNLNTEDVFILDQIRKQLRCSVIEKGIILCNKGTYENIKYKGQIGLELTNGFRINKKNLFIEIIHPEWTNANMFLKQFDNSLVVNSEGAALKLKCENISSFQRVLDYNINLKVIEPVADFKIIGAFKEGKYKLEIQCKINEVIAFKMKSSQMVMVIIAKSNAINVLKSTNTEYKIEDKTISFNMDEFKNMTKFMIGMMFETNEPSFIEMVKVSYRFMDVLPSSMNADLSYRDQNDKVHHLDTVRKCMIEMRWML